MLMKVVLRKDVEKLGEAGTVQNVSGGYARNYLIPNGLAVYATEGELKMAAHNQAVKERKIARQEAQLQSLADKINGHSMSFEARAGENGRLFGAVTSDMIATRLSEEINETIDRRKVLTDGIREVGRYEITVHLVGRLRPVIKVEVTAEGGQPAPATEDVAPAADETTEASADEAPAADEPVDNAEPTTDDAN